ncbi:centrosomal protein of 290 kDa isoform X2 [Lingula anatina]|uniref:Centrosomal protein of 290 kDa isoform X2 n=1 Tax=Lingula anatina TaxID=7574 RepID=A0A1S3JWB1_LINAN|nr:centrosomal protein of 290 kDa isoform X2 [Lingula anatina]|eukprot:XP_013414715.1 centrosomal protein of 290 kDa isoform X2 [Lingula anatina]
MMSSSEDELEDFEPCEGFEPSAWKPHICRNCFLTKEEHERQEAEKHAKQQQAEVAAGKDGKAADSTKDVGKSVQSIVQRRGFTKLLETDKKDDSNKDAATTAGDAKPKVKGTAGAVAARLERFKKITPDANKAAGDKQENATPTAATGKQNDVKDSEKSHGDSEADDKDDGDTSPGESPKSFRDKLKLFRGINNARTGESSVMPAGSKGSAATGVPAGPGQLITAVKASVPGGAGKSKLDAKGKPISETERKSELKAHTSGFTKDKSSDSPSKPPLSSATAAGRAGVANTTWPSLAQSEDRSPGSSSLKEGGTPSPGIGKKSPVEEGASKGLIKGDRFPGELPRGGKVERVPSFGLRKSSKEKTTPETKAVNGQGISNGAKKAPDTKSSTTTTTEKDKNGKKLTGSSGTKTPESPKDTLSVKPFGQQLLRKSPDRSLESPVKGRPAAKTTGQDKLGKKSPSSPKTVLENQKQITKTERISTEKVHHETKAAASQTDPPPPSDALKKLEEENKTLKKDVEKFKSQLKITEDSKKKIEKERQVADTQAREESTKQKKLVEDLQNQIKQAEDSKKKAEKEHLVTVGELEEETKRLKKEGEEHQRKLTAAEEDKKKTEKEKEKLCESSRVLQDDKRKLQKEVDELHIQLKSAEIQLKTSENSQKKLQAEKESLEVKKLKNEISALTSQLKTATDEAKNRAEKEKERIDKSLKEAQEENKKHNQEVIKLKQQLKAATDSTKKVEEERSSEKAKHTKQIAEFQKEIDSLNGRIKAAEELSSNLERSNKELTEKLQELETKYSEMAAKNTGSDGDTEVSKLREENAILKEEMEEMKMEMDEIHDQFREEESVELQELQRELEIAAKNCRILQFKLRKSERKNDQIEADKQMYEERIRSLESQYQSAEDLQHIRELEEELNCAKEVSIRLNEELELVEERRTRYEEENEKYREQIREYANRLLLSEKETKRLTQELAAYKSPGDAAMGSKRQSPEGEDHALPPPEPKRRVLTRSISEQSTSMEDREVSHLRRDLEDVIERESDLREQLRFTEEEVKVLRKKLQETEVENETLSMQLKKMSPSGSRGAKGTKKRQGSLEEVLPPTLPDIAEVVTPSDSESEPDFHLQMEVAEQEAKILRKKLQDVQQENENLFAEVKFLQERLAAEGKVDLSKYGSDIELQLMLDEIDSLKWQLVERDREILELKTKVKAGSLQEAGRKQLIKRSRSLDSDFQIDVKRQLEATQSEATFLKERLEHLEQENDNLHKVNRTLQLAALRKSVPAIKPEDAAFQNIELKESNRILEKENNELKQKLRELDFRTQDLTREVNRREFQRGSDMQRSRELEDQLGEAGEESIVLRRKLAELTEEKSTLLRELNELKEGGSRDQKTRRPSTPEVGKGKELVTSDILNKIAELQEETEDLQIIIKAKDATNEQLEREIEGLKEEMGNLKRTFRHTEGELLNELDQMKQKNEIMQNLLDLVEERADCLQDEIDGYGSESGSSERSTPSERSAISVISDVSLGSDDVFAVTSGAQTPGSTKVIQKDWDRAFKKRVESLERLLAEERQKSSTLGKKVDIMTSDLKVQSGVRDQAFVHDKQKEELQQELQQCQQKLFRATNRATDLENTLQRVQAANELMQRDIDELRDGRGSGSAIWRREKEEMQRKLQEFMKKTEELHQQLQRQEARWSSGQNDSRSTIENEIKTLRDKCADYRAEAKEAKQQAQKIQSMIKEKDEQFAHDRFKLEEEIQNLSQTLNETQATMKGKEDLLKEFQRILKEKDTEIEELEKDYFNVDDELQKQEGNLKEKEAEIKQLHEEIKTMKNQISDKDDNLNRLNESIRTRDERLKEKDEIIRKINGQSGFEITRARRELTEKLLQKDSEFQKLSQEFGKMKVKLDGLSKQESEWRKEQEGFKEQIAKLEENLRKKEQESKDKSYKEKSAWEAAKKDLEKCVAKEKNKREETEKRIDDILRECVRLNEVARLLEMDHRDSQGMTASRTSLAGSDTSATSEAKWDRDKEDIRKLLDGAFSQISRLTGTIAASSDRKQPGLRRSLSSIELEVTPSAPARISAPPLMSASFTEGSATAPLGPVLLPPPSHKPSHNSGSMSASTSRDTTPERQGLQRFKKFTNYPMPTPGFMISPYGRSKRTPAPATAPTDTRPFQFQPSPTKKRPPLQKSLSADTPGEDVLFTASPGYVPLAAPSREQLMSTSPTRSSGDKQSPKSARQHFFDTYSSSSIYSSLPARGRHAQKGASKPSVLETDFPVTESQTKTTKPTTTRSGSTESLPAVPTYSTDPLETPESAPHKKHHSPFRFLSGKDRRGLFKRAGSLESAVKNTLAKIGINVSSPAAPSNTDPKKISSFSQKVKRKLKRSSSADSADNVAANGGLAPLTSYGSDVIGHDSDYSLNSHLSQYASGASIATFGSLPESGRPPSLTPLFARPPCPKRRRPPRRWRPKSRLAHPSLRRAGEHPVIPKDEKEAHRGKAVPGKLLSKGHKSDEKQKSKISDEKSKKSDDKTMKSEDKSVKPDDKQKSKKIDHKETKQDAKHSKKDHKEPLKLNIAGPHSSKDTAKSSTPPSEGLKGKESSSSSKDTPPSSLEREQRALSPVEEKKRKFQSLFGGGNKEEKKTPTPVSRFRSPTRTTSPTSPTSPTGRPAGGNILDRIKKFNETPV